MNEIQAVKTAKIEEVKKNSKKGFTLVELVVVIAILAILAAIAIPVVASTIKSSQVSSAKSNAQTVELAIKEAKAAVSAGDDSVFNAASTGTTGAAAHKASANNLTVQDVLKAKKIESAVAKYTVDGHEYKPYYDKTSGKVVFLTINGTNKFELGVDVNTSGTGKYTGTNLVELKADDNTTNISTGL